MDMLRRKRTLRSWLIASCALGLIAIGTRSPLSAPKSQEGEKILVPAVVGMRTMVGSNRRTPPPWPTGNCFGLASGEVHVINMHAENFEEIVKKLGLKSVEVEQYGGQYLVVDARIPRAWFREKPCPTCCKFDVASLKKYADKFSEPSPKP